MKGSPFFDPNIGPPTKAWEAERIEWVPLADRRESVGKSDIVSGTSMATLLYVLTDS
ncbi:hypothetical protein [Streptosporangium lutulentum]|uniref:Uncharacterized protein n=1 Tax=Streptosporangium lutulentum TaxID=1461250 RepID=A0ABT9QC96_9ACTN|nr:hypothetical protein [Streptosporangium lutulentum]MDP9843933.1 hypothetical protein [Streptosporangium lutulentum]